MTLKLLLNLHLFYSFILFSKKKKIILDLKPNGFHANINLAFLKASSNIRFSYYSSNKYITAKLLSIRKFNDKKLPITYKNIVPHANHTIVKRFKLDNFTVRAKNLTIIDILYNFTIVGNTMKILKLN